MIVPYQPSRRPRVNESEIGRLRYRCYAWGETTGRHVWLLHGWADCALSFQPLVDQLGDEYCLFAPDWRGFGNTSRAPEHYWFPDYLADLERLLDTYSADRKVTLIGHSMGANVAALYAGIRSARVAALACLDAAGLPAMSPTLAPARYAQWLDELRADAPVRDFRTLAELISQIRKIAPRLDPAIAAFVAEHWTTQLPDGRYRLKMDPRHRRVNAVLYRREEAMACWRNIVGPTLFLLGEESKLGKSESRAELVDELHRCFRDCRVETIAKAGHMLHLEAPVATAAALRRFLAGC